MTIQGLATSKDKEEFLISIFKLLEKDLPQDGLQFIETDDYISLRKAGYSDDLLSAA